MQTPHLFLLQPDRAMFKVFLQRTRTKKFCVCLVSEKNGKLVLKGEPLNRLKDAIDIGQAINSALENPPEVLELLPATHRWPKNMGPKRR
jgi:hypothetical protein